MSGKAERMLPPSIDHETLDGSEQSIGQVGKQIQSRKKRVRLSCFECRKQKLSCDRSLPCRRCVRSGRPERCSFETVTGPNPLTLNRAVEQQEQRNSDQIRGLQTEVAELKALLSEIRIQPQSDTHAKALKVSTGSTESCPAVSLGRELQEAQSPALSNRNLETSYAPDHVQPDPNIQPPHASNKEPSDPRKRSPRMYYRQHCLFRFFDEIPALFPFLQETTNELLKPLGIHLNQNKADKFFWKANVPSENESLESFLPPKEDTDALVSFYLGHLEQLHQIVHVPTFEREYVNFWTPDRIRHPAMTALVLAMLSISIPVYTGSEMSILVITRYRTMPMQWISACDKWLMRQSQKYRKLVHYQISCLVYLAKRLNMVKKKTYWKQTGFLMQNAILDGLNREISWTVDTVYTREIRRRIWAVLRELDLQNSFEFGLPTFLYSIDSDVATPINVDDKDFDDTSTEIPMSKSSDEYTSTSYQYHSARSWSLRLEISQRLFGSKSSRPFAYHEVLEYTHQIMQAIDSLPTWHSEETKNGNGSDRHILAYTFLRFQLRECILAIHRSYLQSHDSRFPLSETICYDTSREILHLNRTLKGSGVQNIALLRDDLLLASLTLTRIITLQPQGSTSSIMAGAQSTIDLLEKCLSLTEEPYLRCSRAEPWCFITMYAGIMLLKIHLGEETRQTAKASCAQRFLDMHYKHLGRMQSSQAGEKHLMTSKGAEPLNTIAPGQFLSHGDERTSTGSQWLDNGFMESGVNLFDLDMDLEGTAETWDTEWLELPTY